jgi:hypothetical protein
MPANACKGMSSDMCILRTYISGSVDVIVIVDESPYTLCMHACLSDTPGIGQMLPTVLCQQ